MMMKLDYKTRDWFVLMTAFAGVLKIFLSVWFDIQISDAHIDSLLNLLAFVVIIVVIPANTYVTKRRQEQKEKLQEDTK